MSPIARFIVVQFCLTAVACSDPGGSTSRPPPAAIASDRIPIEQAEGVVVKDPVRTALAFHEGLVGRPPAEAAPASSLLPPPPPPTCGIPPSPPCPPPPFPTLDVNTMSTTAIRTVYQCGTNTQLIRTWPGEHVALPTDCNAGTTIDSGLTPGTNYCYGLVYPDGQLAAPQKCASTLHEPYIFNGPGLTQAESDQMAASFSWANTEYVAATITGGRTAL